MKTNSESLLRFQNITKIFQNNNVETQALSGIQLSINSGEFVTITGPSGCGKSTLLSIAGLIDKPTSGEYWFDGHNLSSASVSEKTRIRNEWIGFVFQAFNLINDMTVFENVELPLLYKNIRQQTRKKMVEEALGYLEMNHRSLYFPSQLSGGQQQRVAVARALVMKPRLLLADEPTGNLDSRSSMAIMRIIREIHQQGTTVCMVTHDTRFTKFSDRSVAMFDGRILEEIN